MERLRCILRGVVLAIEQLRPLIVRAQHIARLRQEALVDEIEAKMEAKQERTRKRKAHDSEVAAWKKKGWFRGPKVRSPRCRVFLPDETQAQTSEVTDVWRGRCCCACAECSQGRRRHDDLDLSNLS